LLLLLQDFLGALSEGISSNPASLESYKRMVDPTCSPEPAEPEEPLTRRELYHAVAVRKGGEEGSKGGGEEGESSGEKGG
jgi:hypothetical protein